VSAPDGGPRAEIESMRQRAASARERAARCEARASALEANLPAAGQPRQKQFRRMRDLFLRAMSQHLMSAEIHELLAARMETWLSPGDAASGSVLMEAIATQLGMASALATLGSQHACLAMTAASDRTARTAHELELVMAEGPATDALRGAQVAAVGTNLLDRWPHYGQAVAELGIHAVCAAPLGPSRVGIGALCAYDKAPAAPERSATATKLMAEALTEVLRGTSRLAKPGERLAILGFLDASDNQSVVEQAVGIVSVQCDCRPGDAADLLAARAFADGVSLPEVARQIVHGETRF
jgi:hypothetical protein